MPLQRAVLKRRTKKSIEKEDETPKTRKNKNRKPVRRGGGGTSQEINDESKAAEDQEEKDQEKAESGEEEEDESKEGGGRKMRTEPLQLKNCVDLIRASDVAPFFDSLKPEEALVVYFYQWFCGACDAFESVWKDVLKLFSDGEPIRFVMVDIARERTDMYSTIRQYLPMEIHGTPTIVFRQGKQLIPLHIGYPKEVADEIRQAYIQQRRGGSFDLARVLAETRVYTTVSGGKASSFLLNLYTRLASASTREDEKTVWYVLRYDPLRELNPYYKICRLILDELASTYHKNVLFLPKLEGKGIIQPTLEVRTV